jgi:hypothetical protein
LPDPGTVEFFVEGYNTYEHCRHTEMNDLQLYIAIGLPTVAVLASLVVSLFQISAVRVDVREVRMDVKLLTGKVADVDNRLSRIEDKLGLLPH